MKPCPSFSRKNFSALLSIALILACSLPLVGCSSEGADSPQATLEIDQLKTENEELHKELDKTAADLEDAESKIKELEDELETLLETQATPSLSPSPSATIDLVPPDRTLSQLLLGEWYLQHFYEDDYTTNYTVSIVFNSDSSGTQVLTFYLPSELNADNYATSDKRGEIVYSFTWSIDGDTVHIVSGSALIDLKFSSEQQQLLVTSQSGETPENEQLYKREMPAIPAEYVKKSVIMNDIQAQETALMRQFFGTWYFDITTWTFNEDGTGVLDIPDVANQPAAKREFTYSATGNAEEPMLAIDWADTPGTAFFLTRKNRDGSIVLGDDLKLTRQFDATNCPLSTQMIQTGIDVFTGRMFYDMLGIEE